MEAQSSSPAVANTAPARSEVDTSRPFRSVREAVAVFGALKASPAVTMKLLPVYSVLPQKPIYSACSSPPSFSSSSSSHFNQDRGDGLTILSTLKKLEAELEETKQELMLLKERESETGVALASLNAELRENMSTKLAEMEAAATKSASSERWGEERACSFEYLPSLSAVLRLDYHKFGGRRKKLAKTLIKKKKKPIVPLIGDIFFNKKKVSSNSQ